jgi:hypothetical protein
VARRAGCGVAAKGGVIDGCCAAYTTSVTPVGVPASPQGEALGATAPVRVNNNLSYQPINNINIDFFTFLWHNIPNERK